MGMAAIGNRLASINIFNRKIKVNIDPLTNCVLEAIGTQPKLKYVTGFINFRTHHMHLMLSGYHEELARNLNLRSSENALKHGWHGFSMICKDISAGTLEVLPCGGGVGVGIPINRSSAFEGYITGMFANKADRILFQQMDYDRQLPAEIKKRWTKALRANDMLWVTKSLSNSELKFLISRI